MCAGPKHSIVSLRILIELKKELCVFYEYEFLPVCIGVYHVCHGLNMLGPGSSTIWRCGLVGVGVSLWVWALRSYS